MPPGPACMLLTLPGVDVQAVTCCKMMMMALTVVVASCKMMMMAPTAVGSLCLLIMRSSTNSSQGPKSQAGCPYLAATSTASLPMRWPIALHKILEVAARHEAKQLPRTCCFGTPSIES